MQPRYVAVAIAGVLLFTARTGDAGAQAAKPAIRGLVSMGAFKFVGSGGDPVNTLEPLNAKPGIERQPHVDVRRSAEIRDWPDQLSS